MTVFRSFLLGTAAFIATSMSARAADMSPLLLRPATAAPAIADTTPNEPAPPPPDCKDKKGYYIVPNTKTCLKINGTIRSFVFIHQDTVASDAWQAQAGAVTGAPTHNDPFAMGVHARLGADAITETDYGPLRGNVTLQAETGAFKDSVKLRYAFIQWAGWTLGHTDSFFTLDGALGGFGFGVGDWGFDRRPLIGYTVELSKELKAAVSIENHDATDDDDGDTDKNAGIFLTAPAPPLVAVHNDGTVLPDLVGNFTGTFDWGTFGVAGALGYYRFFDSAAGGTYEDELLGWAVGASGSIKLDMLSKGDAIQAKVGYADGLTSYIGSSGDVAVIDLVGPDFGLETTAGWTGQGSYQHVWGKTFNSTIWGGYAQALRDTNADTLSTIDGQIVEQWNAGLNLMWQPHENFNLGGEIFYASNTKDNSAGPQDTEGAFGGIIRAERTF